jgi:hypothetical protein
MAMEIDISGIEKDILKYMQTFSEAYAKEGSKQITKKTDLCMEMFYNDYTPAFYGRTYDLRYNSFVPYYHNNGKSYYGGVRITSDFMDVYYSGGIMNYTSTDPFIVAQLSWHGWHGNPTGYNGQFTPIRTTSPLDVLTDFVNSQSFLSSITNHAEKVATKRKYNYLKF